MKFSIQPWLLLNTRICPQAEVGNMRAVFRKFVIAAAIAVAAIATTAVLPGTAQARWGGGYHGGHYGGHWHGGGWGWGGFGWGLGTGLALGWGAPYYGGYYGGYYPYGGYYAYGPGAYGDCYVRRRWVINRYGHRVLRRVTVCY